jgi:hypothetical protein
VHALAFERVEVGRQRGDERLAFAGAHFRDLAQVQHHAADQLHVVMAHAEHAARGFAADGEGFGQKLVERFALRRRVLELRRLRLEFGVGQRLHLRFERVDLLDDAPELAEQAFVTAAEDAGKQAIEHRGVQPDSCGRDRLRVARRPAIKKGAGRPLYGNAAL